MLRSETFLLKFDEIIRSGKAVEIPKGSNRGPLVDTMLTTAGVPVGNPWCAAAIFYCCLETGLYKKTELPRGPAAVRNWHKYFLNKKRVHSDPSQAKRGDLALWLNENGTGHIMAVNEVKKVPLFGWYIRTSEGNGNEEGSREGYKALKKWRRVGKKYQFISFRDY